MWVGVGSFPVHPVFLKPKYAFPVCLEMSATFPLLWTVTCQTDWRVLYKNLSSPHEKTQMHTSLSAEQNIRVWERYASVSAVTTCLLLSQRKCPFHTLNSSVNRLKSLRHQGLIYRNACWPQPDFIFQNCIHSCRNKAWNTSCFSPWKLK